MSKQFLVILAAIVIILGGVLVVTNHNKNKAPTSNAKPTEHIEGVGLKHVTLMEYGDYQCPVCGSFYPAVKQVVAQYGDNIQFQFRNLPLIQIHQNAFAGARAAEAAGLQGKYFAMHDLLYENQLGWSQSSNPQPAFNAYATQLGLNLTQFQRDYSSDQVNNAINADLAAFSKTGDDQATPTFYLDGRKLDNTSLVDANGRPGLSAFTKVIDAEIAKQNPHA